MDDIPFQDDIAKEAEMQRNARLVLGVHDGASVGEMRRAWRRACVRTHPDRNPDNPDAPREFRLVNGAYHYLVDGTWCEELLDVQNVPEPLSHDGRYRLDNAWGIFLWWRDRFF